MSDKNDNGLFGFHRIAAAAPKLALADPAANTAETQRLIDEAESNDTAALLLPELSITGYTCADLFLNTALLDAAEEAIAKLAKHTKGKKVVCVVGAPLRVNSRLYNCALAIQNGNILGVVPKIHIPTYREFYERRWFASGVGTTGTMKFACREVPFGVDLIFERSGNFSFGIEICEDLWSVIPPSSRQALAGATVLLNLSASDELVSKADYRRDLVRNQSARCVSGYVYASAGIGESTTDLVYGGHLIAAENGSIVAENTRFSHETSMETADIDCERLTATRMTETSYDQHHIPAVRRIPLGPLNIIKEIHRAVSPSPFVPANPAERSKRCEEIFSIQTAALARRLEHVSAKKAVLGISGGLDSTLALLVVAETMKLLNEPTENIVAVTMPGFGTTDRTCGNAAKLANLTGAELRTIDITEAAKLHFNDIGHDPDVLDTTYENIQARERTQILMDIANKESGILVGTGDLSEIALGWSTYNGDHMSMYAVNCGVPKTLIRYLISWVADNSAPELKKVLEDIIDTPVSPELLPKNADGSISQKTESILGPYEAHDFFLYHIVKYGASPEKTLRLAKLAFDGKYSETELSEFLNTFVKRFFANQFKRSCIPDGPKVGTISLSPRGDWRMPSDVSPAAWRR
ncbi:MAG: NAD(+) synthase [Victivallales bacterium]|nr:NAD(+) synthase [Victivallales bacterium]